MRPVKIPYGLIIWGSLSLFAVIPVFAQPGTDTSCTESFLVQMKNAADIGNWQEVNVVHEEYVHSRCYSKDLRVRIRELNILKQKFDADGNHMWEVDSLQRKID